MKPNKPMTVAWMLVAAVAVLFALLTTAEPASADPSGGPTCCGSEH